MGSPPVLKRPDIKDLHKYGPFSDKLFFSFKSQILSRYLQGIYESKTEQTNNY